MTRLKQRTTAQPAVDEIGDVFARMEAAWVSDLAGVILGVCRIVCHSAGRTGLALRAFVMRLVHLGRDAHMVDDVSAVRGCGSGKRRTCRREACRPHGGTRGSRAGRRGSCVRSVRADHARRCGAGAAFCTADGKPVRDCPARQDRTRGARTHAHDSKGFRRHANASRQHSVTIRYTPCGGHSRCRAAARAPVSTCAIWRSVSARA